MKSRIVDITGRRFGRLEAIRPSPQKRHGRFFWECKCDCGKTTVVDGNGLRTGNTLSCGCLASELTSERSRKHGHYGTAEYRSWSHMLSRCTNPNVERYKNYGGRGIKVCERWKDFRNFLEDMGPRPGPSYSLNRKDNDGPYEKNNCEWIIATEQQSNTTRTVILTVGGISKTLAQWSRWSGIGEGTIRRRIRKGGWPIDLAVTCPVRKGSRA